MIVFGRISLRAWNTYAAVRRPSSETFAAPETFGALDPCGAILCATVSRVPRRNAALHLFV
jgi:hypothetical protein